MKKKKNEKKTVQCPRKDVLLLANNQVITKVHSTAAMGRTFILAQTKMSVAKRMLKTRVAVK